VESAHFVRTVICAVTCTNTSVVSHLVLALTAMRCCCYRTNCFTRCVVTVLAQHRLEYYLRIVCRSFHFIETTQRSFFSEQLITGLFFLIILSNGLFRRVISVDTKPVHITASSYFRLTTNRYVVLGMA